MIRVLTIFSNTHSREKKVKASDSNILSLNSHNNDSQKDKNGIFEDDVNMVDDDEKEDSQMQEKSYIHKSETANKSNKDQTPETSSNQIKENRRSNRTRKTKESKQKSKMSKNRKSRKRNHEEYSQQDYRDNRSSIAELTKYRSLKIIKEREEIVESRSLAPKVLQF